MLLGLDPDAERPELAPRPKLLRVERRAVRAEVEDRPREGVCPEVDEQRAVPCLGAVPDRASQADRAQPDVPNVHTRGERVGYLTMLNA